MAQAIALAGESDDATALRALVAERGAATHPFLRSVARLTGPAAQRTLADLVHHLCMIHGLPPGIADPTLAIAPTTAMADLLLGIGAGFAGERALLTRLAVAVGAVPSTAGHAQSESAMLAQAHALRMLASSERTGVAAGAAIALALDWAAIHDLLDEAAVRLGLDGTPGLGALPLDAALADLPRATLRAIRFGADQLIEAHRATWSLLAARAAARAAS